MLVAADGVKAAVGGELELIQELVIHVVRAPGVEQGRVDVDPHGRVLLLEILGQLFVGHQVEPQELHGASPMKVDGMAWPAKGAARAATGEWLKHRPRNDERSRVERPWRGSASGARPVREAKIGAGRTGKLGASSPPGRSRPAKRPSTWEERRCPSSPNTKFMPFATPSRTSAPRPTCILPATRAN